MKTTIELSDTTFQRAKAFAAGRGITLKQFFTDAVELHLRRHASGSQVHTHLDRGDPNPNPPWMQGFGELADLGDEYRIVLEVIEEEFEKLDASDFS